MFALRRGAARLAPKPAQLLQTTRRYASGGAHHAPEAVDEPIGSGLIIALAGLPLGCFVYVISRPGENGEAPALTRWLNGFRNWTDVWEERNTLHAAATQQAAFDRTLFRSTPRAESHELRYPEAFHSHSPRNVVAGSVINIDAVTERYKKQHLEEEERKTRKLAAKLQAEKEVAA
ncbi:related to NADH-ubiquinone oxidoreductase 17.8 kDa subunit, mitochondrial [Cephalotrichum gorgonifer]|uniref:Related to NADH-ubiquinone oxidoreductase 17.8 kDa subunit, mitochondrial n=1 Tax=Cephalotrichum gorgonifer TaxID=2041049 RepID=A0AAE8STS9_9PEZI|nr:related to NADH-ubiquinone oxidoreductase 17.8 kDa subunit, mitochondrial [Cephalotrichum gorgonifer]